jgi:penicillin-binding protein 1B
MVGGRRSRFAGFNRALDARRPAGSLLKPAVYLAALEEPERYTLATVLDDTPLSISGPGGSLWEPRNFGREPHGQVPLHTALSRSYNLATARLGMELGPERVAEMMLRASGPARRCPWCHPWPWAPGSTLR